MKENVCKYIYCRWITRHHLMPCHIFRFERIQMEHINLDKSWAKQSYRTNPNQESLSICINNSQPTTPHLSCAIVTNTHSFSLSLRTIYLHQWVWRNYTYIRDGERRETWKGTSFCCIQRGREGQLWWWFLRGSDRWNSISQECRLDTILLCNAWPIEWNKKECEFISN